MRSLLSAETYLNNSHVDATYNVSLASLVGLVAVGAILLVLGLIVYDQSPVCSGYVGKSLHILGDKFKSPDVVAANIHNNHIYYFLGESHAKLDQGHDEESGWVISTADAQHSEEAHGHGFLGTSNKGSKHISARWHLHGNCQQRICTGGEKRDATTDRDQQLVQPRSMGWAIWRTRPPSCGPVQDTDNYLHHSMDDACIAIHIAANGSEEQSCSSKSSKVGPSAQSHAQNTSPAAIESQRLVDSNQEQLAAGLDVDSIVNQITSNSDMILNDAICQQLLHEVSDSFWEELIPAPAPRKEIESCFTKQASKPPKKPAQKGKVVVMKPGLPPLGRKKLSTWERIWTITRQRYHRSR